MSTGKPRLVIHVGGQKCGSSALQGYLYTHRHVLAERGFVYVDRHFGADPGNCDSHNALLPWLRSCDESELLERASALASTHGGATFLLSSEGFCAVKHLTRYAARFALLQSVFDLELVLYARNQASIIHSGWHQWGIGQGLTFGEWVDHCLRIGFADWNRILGEYRRAAPDATIQLRVYDRAQLKGRDIVQDFCELTGVNYRTDDIGSRNANPSLCGSASIAMHSIAQEHAIDYRAVLKQLKKDAPAWAVQERKNRLCPSEMAAHIDAAYEPGNRELLERHGVAPAEQVALLSADLPAFTPLTDEERETAIEAAMTYLRAHRMLRREV